MMSGGPIEKFTEGWAVKIFGFGKGHYYKRDGVGLAYPVCGGDGVPAAMLRDIGTWKLCQRCEKVTGNKTWVSDKAVSDFARVCREQGLELDYERDAKRIKELIADPGEGEEGIAELARLLGQDDPNKDRFRG